MSRAGLDDTTATDPGAELTPQRLLEIDQLEVRYPNGARALRGLSLVLPTRSSTAVVGPSGSGKSTLLHCIGGLVAPTSGSVVVLGRDVGTLSDEDRRRFRREQVGFVFQDAQLLPELDVTANVALPLRLLGHRKRAAMAKAAELLDELGLGDVQRRPLSELSGGQQQRVAVARALVHDPSLLLADEPTGALDVENRDQVLSLLLQAVMSRHAALLMVTHDLLLAARCDAVVEIQDGRVVSTG